MSVNPARVATYEFLIETIDTYDFLVKKENETIQQYKSRVYQKIPDILNKKILSKKTLIDIVKLFIPSIEHDIDKIERLSIYT